MPRSEFGRIATLAGMFGAPPEPDVGIGDDAAVLHPSGAVLATVDASVEGVHFRRGFASLDVLSQRAIEAAASDIAAMGGTVAGVGCGLLLAWTLPADISDDAFESLAIGARRAADRLGTTIVGGNLSSAPTLTLTTTVLGRAGVRTVSRRGARPGDVVAISGAPGRAAVGLHALLQGRADDATMADFVARWRSPRARLDLARDVAQTATAAVDLSDGLLQDAGHLADASGCRLRLRGSALPSSRALHACARALGLQPEALMLSGGEDYELLITSPRPPDRGAWIVIGEVLDGRGVEVVDDEGRLVPTPAQGWDHFAR